MRRMIGPIVGVSFCQRRILNHEQVLGVLLLGSLGEVERAITLWKVDSLMLRFNAPGISACSALPFLERIARRSVNTEATLMSCPG
jgi:hypothetical protein